MATPIVTIAAGGLVALAIVAEPAFAAPNCADLSAELAQLELGPSRISAAKAEKYQRQWTKQSAALARERANARQANCSGRGFLFFRTKPQPECKKIMPRLKKLQTSVEKLDRFRQRNSTARSRQNRISRIRRLMMRKNCPDNFKMASFRNRAEFDAFFNDRLELNRGPGNTFRTLCVRACDGYYFPISFSTTREQFAADQEACEALCPGAQVDLYYHADPSSASENMVSLSGAPYENHSAAFRYRSKYDQSCTCGQNRPPLFTETAQLRLSLADGGLSPDKPDPARGIDAVPVPIARPDPGEDPETLINRAGDFQIGAVTRLVGATGSSQRSGPPIRIVGPVYWGDQAKEEVVLIPVPN